MQAQAPGGHGGVGEEDRGGFEQVAGVGGAEGLGVTGGGADGAARAREDDEGRGEGELSRGADTLGRVLRRGGERKGNAYRFSALLSTRSPSESSIMVLITILYFGETNR